MFSLIITIISIALVAVLALATLYYGGDAFNKGSAAAKAAQLVNEGQQIAGALQLAEQDLVAGDQTVAMTKAGLVPTYLQSLPAGYAALKAGPLTATPSDTEFNFSAGKRVFTNGTAVSEKVCKEINKKAGFTDSDTAATDTADALVVDLAADSDAKIYGCDTTTKVVFYNF